MIRFSFPIVTVVGLCLSPLRGQQPKTESSPAPSAQTEPQVELMTMSQKGAEMRRLAAALQGTWSLSEEYANGGTGSGKQIWRLGPGGTPLVQEYTLKSSIGKESSGFAIIWWDNTGKNYQGLWCSDFNDEGCSRFDVKWIANEIEFTGRYLDSGRRVAWRETFDLITSNSFVQTLEMAKEGDKLERISTTRAKRSATASQETSP